MKTVGLVISHKNNEKRRALLPEDLDKIKHLDYLFFEKGYGDSIGLKIVITKVLILFPAKKH